MAESYVTLWTQERCKWLRRVNDVGPLTVIFGGPHISLPSIKQLSPGDVVYPVGIEDGKLLVIARMVVSEIVPVGVYLSDYLKVEDQGDQLSLFASLQRTRPELGHQLPYGCVDDVAMGCDGAAIRYDRAVPPAVLSDLRLGPGPERERPITGLEAGRLKRSTSFAGHVRRLSRESADLFAQLVQGLN